MAGDWIALHRRLAKHDLWTSEPFTRGQAWVDLLMLANFKVGYVRIRGNRIDLERGQLAGSGVFLAKRWQWSRGKVQRFLDELENEHQIEQQKNAVTTLITITNYDAYQQNGQETEQQTDSRRTADDTADRQQIEQQTDTQEKETTRNNKNKEGQQGKQSSRALRHDDRDMGCAKWFYESVKNIWHQAKEPNLEGWANTIRLMRERDGRTYDEIASLFRWANNHEFWGVNIRSPEKLRKQWEELTIRRDAESRSQSDPLGINNAAQQYMESEGLA